jgi:hypothetical protein
MTPPENKQSLRLGLDLIFALEKSLDGGKKSHALIQVRYVFGSITARAHLAHLVLNRPNLPFEAENRLHRLPIGQDDPPCHNLV